MYYLQLEIPHIWASTLSSVVEEVWAPKLESHIAFETRKAAASSAMDLGQKLIDLINRSDDDNRKLGGYGRRVTRLTPIDSGGAAVEFDFYGFKTLAAWHIVEKQKEPYRMRVVFREANTGIRYTYVFPQISDFLANYEKDEHLTEDSEILLVEDDGAVIYSAFPPKMHEEDSVHLSDIFNWFSEN